MARPLSEKELADWNEAFNLFDKNNDGFLNYTAVRDMLISKGMDASEDMVQTVIQAIDHDDDGKINFAEFVNMMSKFGPPPEPEGTQLEQMFRLFDRDHDNHITYEEMKRTIEELENRRVPSDEIEQMIREADSDGDGKLTFDEFKAVMEKTHGPME